MSNQVEMEKFRTIKRKSRQVKRKIFFIVEGEKTEQDYCKELLNVRYPELQSEVVILPENNVEKIKQHLLEKGYQKDFDICYIFQDLDRYSEGHYPEGKKEHQVHCNRYEILKEEYQFIFTQPSFEYSVFLHLAKSKVQKDKVFETKEEIIKEMCSILKPKNLIGVDCKDFYRLSGCSKMTSKKKDNFFGKKASAARDTSINHMQKRGIKEKDTIDKYLAIQNFSMIGLVLQELDAILSGRNDNKHVERHG